MRSFDLICYYAVNKYKLSLINIMPLSKTKYLMKLIDQVPKKIKSQKTLALLLQKF